MRAFCIREFGGTEKLTLENLDEPVPGPGQALIDVKAAALNHLNIHVRKGRPGLTLSSAHIMGSDGAGILEAYGPGCESAQLEPGQEVVVNPAVSCMRCEYCLRGLHSECPALRIVGFQVQGLYAERALVPAANLFPKPGHLSWEEAAALPLAHLTAYRMLMTRANLRPGETVLIHGIGGGVALAALQFCKALGARAIVTSKSPEKLAMAENLGASALINYRETPDVAAAVKSLTHGRGVDVVVDSVGAATLVASMTSVRRGGRIVTCGITSGAEGALNLQQLYWNHVSLLGSTLGSMEDMRQMLNLVENAKIKPVIDTVYNLEDCVTATRRMEEGAQFGKLVLKIA